MRFEGGRGGGGRGGRGIVGGWIEENEVGTEREEEGLLVYKEVCDELY